MTTSPSRSTSRRSSRGCRRCCAAPVATRRSPAPGLMLDPAEHTVAQDGARSTLTPTEFRLLTALAARRGTRLRAARAGPRGVAARRDRARQHPRRLHRPAAPQARLAAPAAADRHGARHRLPPRTRVMSRPGLRGRLRLSVVGAVALALIAAPGRVQHRAARAAQQDANNALYSRASAELASPARGRGRTDCA